jgi:hypothetical protein
MLNKKVKSYLKEEEEEKNSLKEKKDILSALKSEGVDENSSFAEFMSSYEGEFYGKEGVIINVGIDILDKENSLTSHIRKTYNVPESYLPLFNLEVDDFLFYNKLNDTVTLVEAGKMDEFLKGGIIPQWKSFNAFLIYFFEIDE